jgi:hypothetical protein
METTKFEKMYEKYLNRLDAKFRKEDAKMIGKRDALCYGNIDYTKDEFLKKINADAEFAKKWEVINS